MGQVQLLQLAQSQTRVANITLHLVLLNLERLRPVEQNDNWKGLVLPPGHRKMVQATVENHTQDMGPNKDVTIGIDLVQG